MTPLATVQDVEARLERPLTPVEESAVDGLLEEASSIALAHMRLPEGHYDNVDNLPVPTMVKIVVSRMVARVLTRRAESEVGGLNVPVGATQRQETAGPFSGMTTFVSGSTSGGPWLERMDRLQLDQARGDRQAFTIDTAPGRSTAHADVCSLNFGAAYCSCGASIAGHPIYEVDE